MNPQHPAPVAARGMSGIRVTHTLVGAMAKAPPCKVPAAYGGGEAGITFGGYHPNRKAWVYVEFDNDGPRGGGPFFDGADGLAAPGRNMANTPIETIETDHPLMVERFALVPDTGGPGRYRGGMAITREFRVMADEATFQLRTDRHDHPAWGVEGGKPGTMTRNYINPDTNGREIPAKHLTTMKKGDLYRLVQASAGGYGEPLDRDVNAVLDDVEQEKMSVDHAREEYGVVIDSATLEPDLQATRELRMHMRTQRDGPAS